MRDLFINALEKIINVIVIVALIAVVIGAGVVSMNPPPGIPGLAVGLGVLIGGILYVIVFAGFMYLAFGIYQNTRRTAEAVERLTR